MRGGERWVVATREPRGEDVAVDEASVYRVWFRGELGADAPALLNTEYVRWEGSSSGPGERSGHRALAAAKDEAGAVQAVEDPLVQGGCDEFQVELVSYRGADGRMRPFSLDHIDWSAVRSTPPLTPLQQSLQKISWTLASRPGFWLTAARTVRIASESKTP